MLKGFKLLKLLQKGCAQWFFNKKNFGWHPLKNFDCQFLVGIGWGSDNYQVVSFRLIDRSKERNLGIPRAISGGIYFFPSPSEGSRIQVDQINGPVPFAASMRQVIAD